MHGLAMSKLPLFKKRRLTTRTPRRTCDGAMMPRVKRYENKLIAACSAWTLLYFPLSYNLSTMRGHNWSSARRRRPNGDYRDLQRNRCSSPLAFVTSDVMTSGFANRTSRCCCSIFFVDAQKKLKRCIKPPNALCISAPVHVCL